MKKLIKVMRGVTLLEVMLVLAIAAMIIVMSVRYYQSATSNQQANAVLGQVQAIAAAADQLAQATGSYVGGGVTSTNILPLLPKNGLNTPWGTTITFGTATATTYTFTIPGTPSGVCPLVKSKLEANSHYTSVTSCTTGLTNMAIVYTSNI